MLDIVPEHIFTSYDSNYNVGKKKETVKKGKKNTSRRLTTISCILEATDKVFSPCIQTLTSVQYRAKVAFEEEHDSPWTVVGIY